MMGILDGNAHLFQGKNGVASKVACHVKGGKVKVAAMVKHFCPVGVFEVVVLKLRANIHHIAQALGLCSLALQHVSGIAIEEIALGRFNGAEHTPNSIALRTPRQDLKCGSFRICEHIRFARRGKTANAAAVKAHSLFESVFQFTGNNRKRLHVAQHIAEPKRTKCTSRLFIVLRTKSWSGLVLIACPSVACSYLFHCNKQGVTSAFRRILLPLNR